MISRFFFAIKEIGTDKEIWKERFVLQRYKDAMKQSLVYNTYVSKHSSTKIIIELSAISGFQLYSSDVTQAYLQSSEHLTRKLYLDPSKEINLKPNKLIQLLKPLHGLAESGDYWGRTF